MVVATHVVKVRGTFDRNIWNDDMLRKYIRKKIICEIDDSFHMHLELFKINNDNDNKVINPWRLSSMNSIKAELKNVIIKEMPFGSHISFIFLSRDSLIESINSFLLN